MLLLPEPSARGLCAHYRGIFQGSQEQGFQDDFRPPANLAETLPDLVHAPGCLTSRAINPDRTAKEWKIMMVQQIISGVLFGGLN
ncbi:MAG TPA: hypothetical protein DD424_09145 [Porphyromonadaceae bacterium]|nr:hypothetical protein [Porphyromonadaceae bacterium]